MNIPMAYDALPAQQQSAGYPGASAGVVVNGGRAAGAGRAGALYGAAPSNPTNAMGQHGEGNQEALLLNEHEQLWQQEMQAEGLGHLPVSWFRQTPHQAVWGAYGLINRVLSGLINFGLNAGIGYAILHDNDRVGLWQKPEAGEAPYKSAAFSDLLATTFIITFLTCWISTPGIRAAMKKGQTVPVENEMLQSGYYACTPIRMLGTCTRSLLLAIWSLIVIYLPFLAILEIICAAGGFDGSGGQCAFASRPYIWIKAAFAFVVAWVIYPLVLLCTLNTATLPPLDLTFFAENQKQRWEEKQRQAMPPPL